MLPYEKRQPNTPEDQYYYTEYPYKHRIILKRREGVDDKQHPHDNSNASDDII